METTEPSARFFYAVDSEIEEFKSVPLSVGCFLWSSSVIVYCFYSLYPFAVSVRNRWSNSP